MMLTTDETTTFVHEIGARGSVRLETIDTEIRLRGVPGTAVRLRLAAGDLGTEFRIEATDGRLEVRPVKRWVFGARRDVGPLEVEVPQGARVRAQTASGTILALDLIAGIEAKSAAGGLDLVGLAGDVTAETVSGSIRLRGGEIGRLAAKTVSGSIDARATSLRSMTARSISGSVRVSGRFADDGPHGIETVSGGVTVATDGEVQLRASTVSGVIRTDQGSLGGGAGRGTLALGGHGPVLEVRTVSGGIQVRRWRPDTTAGWTEQDGSRDADRGTAPGATVSDATVSDATVPDEATSGDRSSAPEPEPEPEPEPVDLDPRLPILRALQRGEIDVAEAERRLTALESATTPGAPTATAAPPAATPGPSPAGAGATELSDG